MLDEQSVDDFVLLGSCAMIDPPRPEAVVAAGRCREAGIRVKMITGDHALTARAIAREVGLVATEAAVSGPELAGIDDNALMERALASDVSARVTPEQKLRLVEALQRRGAVVAMTGGGVNDAPALTRGGHRHRHGCAGNQGREGSGRRWCWPTATSPPSRPRSRKAAPSTTT